MQTPFQDSVEILFDRMKVLVPAKLYPSEVLRLNDRITTGTAFFPGGMGLHLKNRNPKDVEFPIGGVMVLGHNYDSEAGFGRSLDRGEEDLGKGTWAGLRRLFDDAKVPVEACFFTNAFMGLCKGSDNKSYRGRIDPAFRAACLTFLKVQIGVQSPRLILALGVKVPPFLAEASADLKAWRGRPKRGSCDPDFRLKDLDATPLFHNATFNLDDGCTHTCTVTAIAHPSDRRNGAKRTPLGFPKGNAGEIALIRTGWTGCDGLKA